MQGSICCLVKKVDTDLTAPNELSPKELSDQDLLILLEIVVSMHRMIMPCVPMKRL